ncbi:MAG: metallophosphoesterase [Thermoprotei archaeon]|nr:MAG: metallophosphoesterase [Thermoprotei archaeon]
MLVGIISDTHDRLPLIEKVLEKIKNNGVDLILHAGDIISPFSLKRFKDVGQKTLMVYGNNDGEKVLLDKIAKELGIVLREGPLIIKRGGYRILMFHGLEGKDDTNEFAKTLAKSGEYDLVVYGHTHEAVLLKEGETLLVNPGEVCGYLTGKSTLAFVNLAERRGEIVEIK